MQPKKGSTNYTKGVEFNFGGKSDLVTGATMLFMVSERFRQGDAKAVYERFRERGRMMPNGLDYVDSWVEASFTRCFQLVRSDDPALIGEWTAQWDDLVDFEIVPVITSKEAAAIHAS